MKSAKLAVIALAALGASACTYTMKSADVEYTATNAPPREMHPRSTESVIMYSTSIPDRKYLEVGVLRADASGSGAMNRALQQLRREAARIGCDGVMLATAAESTYSERISYHGACIMFTEGEPTYLPPTDSNDDREALAAQRCADIHAELRRAESPEERQWLIKRAPPDCFRDDVAR